MSELSPLLGVKKKSGFGAVRAALTQSGHRSENLALLPLPARLFAVKFIKPVV